MAKAATLKRKEALNKQEVKLKAEKEELELKTALAASDAKLEVLKRFEKADVLQKDDEHSKPQEKKPATVKKGHRESESGH